MPDGRLGLDLDELLVVLDVEDGLRRVDDAPDDDRRDLDRVADRVVDLEDLAVEVLDAQRDDAAQGEWPRPGESAGVDGPEVRAQEGNDRRLVRLDDDETGRRDPGGDGDDSPAKSRPGDTGSSPTPRPVTSRKAASPNIATITTTITRPGMAIAFRSLMTGSPSYISK